MSTTQKLQDSVVANKAPVHKTLTSQHKSSKKILNSQSTPSNSVIATSLRFNSKGNSKLRNRAKQPDEKDKANFEMNVIEQALVAETPLPGRKKQKSKKNKNSTEISRTENENKNEVFTTWKQSPHLGGRYLALDPVFSPDDNYLLIAQANSLKIYCTKTSLLVRTIALRNKDSDKNKNSERIVSYFLDFRAEDRVYIATSFGNLSLWNFTNGQEISQWDFERNFQHVCTCRGQILEGAETEVVYVVMEGFKESESAVWRFSLSEKSVIKKSKVYTSLRFISAIQVLDGGRAVCFISGKHVVIINQDKKKWDEPRIYKTPHELKCMDAYLSSDVESRKPRKGTIVSPRLVGDIVVGDSAGIIYVLRDVIKPSKKSTDFTPQKLHWHRMPVSSVKWALDGNYVLSGGSETVLVIWQLETGHRQFLPHLGSEIKNIIVSPKGSSYVVGLSDNSIMILSTAELKPKANIAGIQSFAQFRLTEPRHVPCILHPTQPNNLLIATPSSQLDQTAGTPYLQTFDTYSDRHISRQALARTNVTTHSQGLDFAKISEPSITFLAVTSDGKWLASVDEWRSRKINSEKLPVNLLSVPKVEIYLKFWKWSESRKEWELITRVDAPHPSSGECGAEKVMDLISTPNGQTFATLGSDGCVKIWKPKIKARPGVPIAASPVVWVCRKSIKFSHERFERSALPLSKVILSQKWWGNAAFSEDCSVLAISCPGSRYRSIEDSTVHLIDPEAGVIRQTLGGLHIGRTSGIAITERYLIVAGSAKLLVWNLVHGKVEWECITADMFPSDCVSANIHLAADPREKTFAVVISPIKKLSANAIFVFQPASNPRPVHTATFEAPILALKSAGSGKGFMVLDCTARVQYITPVLAPHTSIASILAGGQRLDGNDQDNTQFNQNSEDTIGLSKLYINQKYDSNALITNSRDFSSTDGSNGGDDEAELVDKVISREVLEGLLDQFSLYSPGSVRDAFSKVFELFARPPLGDDNDEYDEDEDENNVLNAMDESSSGGESDEDVN